MKKVIIAYLSSGFVDIKSLKTFLVNFKKNKPGYPHELFICFKLLKESERKKREKLIKKYNIFYDEEQINDHEWGTLKRLCMSKKNRKIFWMNDHSYPVKKNWLKKIMNYDNKNIFIGTSGSFSSHYSNSFYRHKNDSYLKAIIKIIFFLFSVPSFPNPHIRTTGFLINSNDFIEFMKFKWVRTKLQSFLIESGNYSLTNFFKKKNYDIFVVNKEGKKFDLNSMKKSFTFAYGKQDKFLISDNQIRTYSKLSANKKIKRAKHVWGKDI